jgi:2-isopropylmalate synthase
MERLIVFDTTLRDGEQSPGASLNTPEKIEIAHQLARLGVNVIEAGFPIASPGDFEAVSLIAKEVKGPEICGLARCVKADIDAAWNAVKYSKKPRIHLFLATSDIHLEKKLKITRAQMLEMARESVRYARSLCPNVEFSAEDAVRSDPHFLCQVFGSVVDAGASTINVPDTVGYAIPYEYGELIRTIVKNVANIHKAVVSVHCHNDLGLSVANSLAAVRNGARQVECTINGIGERAGNASLEEIVMSIKTRPDVFKVDTSINTQEIFRTSRLVSKLTGMPVQPNKAVVGANAFSHESGIHQDGVIKHRQTYEIMTPEDVGVPSSQLILGKHSGRHAFAKRLKELGHEVSTKELKRIFDLFKILADKKKYVFDEDILSLIEEQLVKASDAYVLDFLQTTSGTGVKPSATLKLKYHGKLLEQTTDGDGPVDAAYKAIDKITGVGPKLIDYRLEAVSGGKDAQGEVTAKVEYKGVTFRGRGTSTDIIEASAKAYLAAVNKILAYKTKHEPTKKVQGKV